MPTSDVLEPRAFGGGALKGDHVTKFVHMDEAGISHGEPFCSQAGVVVTADQQWKLVEKRLKAILVDLVPPKYRAGYIFHAKDIFQGTDSYYTRERFPDPKMRAAVVRRVASIAADFDLPVFVGFVEKARFKRVLKWKPVIAAAHFHSLAFHVCVHSIEAWMRENTPKDEVAMLFVENNNQSKKMLALIHKVNTGGSAASFQRIIEMPNFVEKQDSSLLQIADACAFSFNRHRRALSFGDFLIEGFADQLRAFEYRTN